jgi:hypothetical protein
MGGGSSVRVVVAAFAYNRHPELQGDQSTEATTNLHTNPEDRDRLADWCDVCGMDGDRRSMHCGQGLHNAAIADPNNADTGIIQVDGHPQGDRKHHTIDGIE